MRDPYHSTLPKPSINPGAITATATGASVDRAGSGKMYQAAMVIVQTGTMTDGSHAITLEESDDNSTWATATAIDGSAPTLAAADDNTIKTFGYTGTKRFLRVKSTVTGATTGGIYGASILLADPRVLPTQ